MMTHTTDVQPDSSAVLAAAVNDLKRIRTDVNNALTVMGDRIPLFASIDATIACGHLREATVFIERAAQTIEAAQR